MKITITADPEIAVPPLHYGGIERIIDMLIRELVNRGHEVTLYANKDSDTTCKIVNYSGSYSQKITDVVKNTLITSKILFDRPDVIHSFGRIAYLAPLLPFSVAKLQSYQREPTLSRIKLAMKMAKFGSLSFTGCSKYISDQILPYAPAYPVYNGVDVTKYELTKTVDDDAPLVFLGRIEAIKGTHNAIEIAQKSGRKLMICGNVPTDERSQEYFNTKIKPHIDDQRIIYVGSVNDIQKNEILGSAAAFLMPIEWNEPFGIVMAEALACGTPVIGFPKGAVAEVVEDGVNGFQCANNQEAIESIKNLHTIDRTVCRSIAEQKYSATAITSEYERIYSLISKK